MGYVLHRGCSFDLCANPVGQALRYEHLKVRKLGLLAVQKLSQTLRAGKLMEAQFTQRKQMPEATLSINMAHQPQRTAPSNVRFPGLISPPGL